MEHVRHSLLSQFPKTKYHSINSGKFIKVDIKNLIENLSGENRLDSGLKIILAVFCDYISSYLIVPRFIRDILINLP